MADLLRTDYKDDILNTDVNTKRKYRMVQNDDGTVSFEDMTEYAQVGDSFGAADINKTNLAIDELNKALGSTLEWKKVATVTGKTPIELPTKYNELMIASAIANTGYMFSTIINKDMLENGTYTYLQDGFAIDYRAYWIYTSTSITLNGLVIGGDYSTTAITTLYYR